MSRLEVGKIYYAGIIWRIIDTVKPLNKGHFGDNINSAVLSLVEMSSSPRFLMHGNYMDSNILGLAVSLVERSNIQCPFLGGSFIRSSTVCIRE